ncbi:MAG: pyruvate dehydrogenase (acetyl-transferring), homodimeric type [Actinobacteria bacterium]|nr:pyruvate dehydrogenase (acetyl-transferring), homodimeric type [Actinomycetota bacterium]MCB9413336.1 pyruvate dehydrogenase (acetyl-transferring), homodimeric type [Actinomycetota bacterium]
MTEPRIVKSPLPLPHQYVDPDPGESQEWLDSLDALAREEGADRARFLLRELQRRASELDLGVPDVRQTDYINTIHPEDEPVYPGDIATEKRFAKMVRWNAAMMVHRAQRPGIGVGGHISTFASSATLYEVAFNHYFRGPDHPGGGDQVFFQGHASPGIYARSFLLGRFGADLMDGFRQELSHAGGGLPSYPHPRLMPGYWQFPTVSMGLGPLHAIYQARFNRYLTGRGIKDTSEQHVWAFVGDGETDEPETLGKINLAAREELDNLTFVINCNLQRLDGPVNGNGKIIQELEALYRGAGWNVIKVIWGTPWDQLLAQDTDGALVNLMNNTLDGDYQTMKAEDGGFIREYFFNRDPRTAAMVADWSDDQIWALYRGGHDYTKLNAAYSAALAHKGRPTVILAKTVKGYTLGSHFEGRNSTHQMKKLTLDDIKGLRDRLEIPIPDSELDPYLPPYYNPGIDDPVVQYALDHRRDLGGFVPSRHDESRPLVLPGDKVYEVMTKGSGKQEVATTMAFVRLLKDLVKDPEIGHRIVPIIPDEARTFGMDAMFPTQKIFNQHGQLYTAVDRELLLSYKESTAGQILHEGINEAGSMATFAAAGTSYSTHDEPMIPVYIFYSMFGYQRTGDQFWLAMDQRVRGFVIGATAGRTTLNGEGLQHEDGHSPLMAATNPVVVYYDPAYAYEIVHIVKDGLRRMYGENSEDIFYYLTVYNEPIPQPAQPADVDVDGILKGMHLVSPAASSEGPQAQILAAGIALPWAMKAQRLLADEWGVQAAVWSVTSWTELRRDGLAVDRHNLTRPTEPPQTAFVTQKLTGRPGPVVAVSDYMTAVQDLIRPWVPSDYYTLGTDGWGMSDTRGALRRHFLVDAESIAVQTLSALSRRGEIPAATVAEAINRYRLWDPAAADAGSTEGGG